MTRHGYEVAPRFRSNPNVPGRRDENPQQSQSGAYEVFIRPYQRPGKVFYKLISDSKKRRIVHELKKDEYIESVPDDVVASMESLHSPSQRSETSSTGTQSMRSLRSTSERGDTTSRSSLGAASAMSTGSNLELLSTSQEPEDDVTQQDTMPAQINPPFNLDPQGDIQGVFEFEDPTEFEAPATTSEGAVGYDPMFKVPEEPAPQHHYRTRSKAQDKRKRDTVEKRFRHNLLLQKQAREFEKRTEDPLGQNIMAGRQELEREQDMERQRM